MHVETACLHVTHHFIDDANHVFVLKREQWQMKSHFKEAGSH